MAENKCDELFGKNGELVEFRKKQVLEGAFGIIQRNYEDKPNKMEVIAKLFGKKLGEEFVLSEHHSRYSCLYTKREKATVFNPHYGWTTEYKDVSDMPDYHYVKCKITTEGLFTYNIDKKYWQKDEDDLSDLLTGRAVIVDEKTDDFTE